MKTILLAALLLATSALADDRIRDVQVQLKADGFYYGKVDGVGGSETTAAIRRYQIRNGLEVSGKLDTETLAALGIGGSPAPSPAAPAAPAPAPHPPMEDAAQLNPPAANERPAPTAPQPKRIPEPSAAEEAPPTDYLRPPRAADDDVQIGEARRLDPDDPAYVEPPTPIPNPVADDYTAVFRGTPYESAPRELQIDILRKAQGALARRGLYRTLADGVPGPATADALFTYQQERRLTRTGRLDLSTLSAMGLLPGRSADAPALRPFYDPSRRRDRSVDYNSIGRY